MKVYYSSVYIQNITLSSDTETTSNRAAIIGVLVGGAVGLILLVIATVVIIVLKKKKKNKKSNKSEEKTELQEVKTEYGPMKSKIQASQDSLISHQSESTVSMLKKSDSSELGG